MSIRKSTARAKLKAVSQEERIHLGKQYFRNLLGKSPKVMDEPITKTISNQVEVAFGYRINIFINMKKGHLLCCQISYCNKIWRSIFNTVSIYLSIYVCFFFSVFIYFRLFHFFYHSSIFVFSSFLNLCLFLSLSLSLSLSLVLSIYLSFFHSYCLFVSFSFYLF